MAVVVPDKNDAAFGAIMDGFYKFLGNAPIPMDVKSIEDQGFETFVVSPQQTLQWIVISILAGVIAAIIPAMRASKQNILQAISYE